MKTKSYITTAIPYVNAQPHVGFALELVQADAIARQQRRAGLRVRFQTGTDENAFKNVEAARGAGVDTHEWVATHAAQFRQLADDLQISYDRFLRTTEAAHFQAVHALWRSLRPGDVYVKAYQGLYCSGCEDFLFAKDLIDGQCPEHHRPPTEIAETNYFFRLSAYQEQIEQWLTSGALSIRPEKRRNEILHFVRAGLQDISISRLAERSDGWGVPVPDDPTQVVYVWIDALVNYLAGLGYGAGDAWREWWNEETRKIHVIGRNVWKFHAVYWPALLLSAGLPLPDELVIHGFLTSDGQKISKSLGNAISPDHYIHRYGVDAVRYFFLRAVSPFDDGDFSALRFASIYEADLANGLGNLVSRLLALASKCALGSVAIEGSLATNLDFEHACNVFRHDEGLDLLWQKIAELNREIEQRKPWASLQYGESAAVQAQVAAWLQSVGWIARNLEPFLPETADKILRAIRCQPLKNVAPLFPRITAVATSHPME